MPKKQWLWSRERVEAALKNDELEISKGKDVIGRTPLFFDTKNIKESSHKLIGLINSIVDMSKLEVNEKRVINPRKVIKYTSLGFI